MSENMDSLWNVRCLELLGRRIVSMNGVVKVNFISVDLVIVLRQLTPSQ